MMRGEMCEHCGKNPPIKRLSTLGEIAVCGACWESYMTSGNLLSVLIETAPAESLDLERLRLEFAMAAKGGCDPMKVNIGDMSRMLSAIDRLTAERDEAIAESAEQSASFDLRWKADMRAIKAWQEANPGNELVWPDHADLCVWLLGERDAAQAAIDGVDLCDVDQRDNATPDELRVKLYGAGLKIIELEATLGDEEAAHQETLDMLRVQHQKMYGETKQALAAARAEVWEAAASLAKNWEPTESDPGVFHACLDLDVAASIAKVCRERAAAERSKVTE